METGSSDGSESACNVGDLDSISGSGRLAGQENVNPLQYSCLVNSMDRGSGRLQSMGCKESDMVEWLILTCFAISIICKYFQSKFTIFLKISHYFPNIFAIITQVDFTSIPVGPLLYYLCEIYSHVLSLQYFVDREHISLMFVPFSAWFATENF